MKANLQTSLKVFWCALLVSTFCYGAADSETLYNGSYQIELRQGDYVSTAKSQFLLKAGEKAKARMEPSDIEMSIRPVSEVEYDFHLVVTVTPNRTPRNPARVDKVYRGRFGVPLELGTSDGQFKVNGSVAVLRYKPRA